MLHRCTDAKCSFTGQRTSTGCACHMTDEQVLKTDNERLREALQRIADDFIPCNRSEESIAIEEMRDCARSALEIRI